MAQVVLGLNGANGIGHDAAAALIVDDRIVVAVEEERLSRTKRAYGLPPIRSISEALDLAGLTLRDVDVVAYPWMPSAMGVHETVVSDQLRSWLAQASGTQTPEIDIRFVEHHEAHAWAGVIFARNSIHRRQAAVLVLDGSGESTSGAAFAYNGSLDKKWNLRQSSSLGIYYEAMTQFVGFAWGDEGKAMGLASYGRLREIPTPDLPDQRFAGKVPHYINDDLTPRDVHISVRAEFIDEMRAMYGENLSFNERADVALAVQRELIGRILFYVGEIAQNSELLVLSGGVALNCHANAEVASYCRRNGLELVIPPPASDTGVAIGAAVAACDDQAKIRQVTDPFLGRGYSPNRIVDRLRQTGLHVVAFDSQQLAGCLADQSLLCGWFDGRSEVGPRALGNRSILARPDSTKVRDRLNYLKGRESWRPLAPSVTEAEFDRSFPGSTPSSHMLINATAVGDSASRLAGVIHVDNSSRPQVVIDPGPYREVLAAMEDSTGSAAVICTSFNGAGEPMVYTPEEAVDSARAMNLDLLAGNGWCCDLRRT